jgi:hypothetical protein
VGNSSEQLPETSFVQVECLGSLGLSLQVQDSEPQLVNSGHSLPQQVAILLV